MARKKIKERDQNVAIGYIRVSTNDQKLSVTAQREDLELWCKARGCDLAAVYIEEGVSGGAALDKRDGLMNALDAVEEFNAGVFLATKGDRIARSTMNYLIVQDQLRRDGARLVTADGVGEDESDEGQLMKIIFAGVAEYERARIRKRTIRIMRSKRKKGEATSKPPIGARIAENSKALVMDALEMQAVMMIKTHRDSGKSIREITRLLNAAGVQSRGKQWYPTTVMRIVKRLADKSHAFVNSAVAELEGCGS